MPPSSSSQQKQKQNPALPPRGVKRARPLGLLKARRTTNAPLGALGEQRQFAAVDSDRDFCSFIYL